MITKKQLRDWLDNSERTKVLEQMESYIDEEIKYNVLKGKTTFEIHTVIGNYFWGINKTSFYFLWYSKKLSEENLKIVRSKIIEMYQENYFDVTLKETETINGKKYDILKFTDIENALNN